MYVYVYTYTYTHAHTYGYTNVHMDRAHEPHQINTGPTRPCKKEYIGLLACCMIVMRQVSEHMHASWEGSHCEHSSYKGLLTQAIIGKRSMTARRLVIVPSQRKND